MGESRVISVRLSDSLVAELESLAKQAYKNRSIVIRELLVEALLNRKRDFCITL